MDARTRTSCCSSAQQQDTSKGTWSWYQNGSLITTHALPSVCRWGKAENNVLSRGRKVDDGRMACATRSIHALCLCASIPAPAMAMAMAMAMACSFLFQSKGIQLGTCIYISLLPRLVSSSLQSLAHAVTPYQRKEEKKERKENLIPADRTHTHICSRKSNSILIRVVGWSGPSSRPTLTDGCDKKRENHPPCLPYLPMPMPILWILGTTQLT